jgi:predicted RNA-binding Zn-ribbon protein involved in translation (DUF1610 family)
MEVVMTVKKARPSAAAKDRAPTEKQAMDMYASSGQMLSITSQDRQRMIAEAAYYIAAQRGFAGGDPIQDWIEAERQINRVLPSPKQQKDELAAYEKFRSELTTLLVDLRGSMNAEHIQHAFDMALEKLHTAGDYAADTISKVAATTKKDMANLVSHMGPGWEKYSAKTADLFAAWRDRGSSYIASAAAAVGEWSQQVGAKAGHQVYRSGEVTYGGTLECTACKERITLQTAAHVPLCPACRNMEFHRVHAQE